MKTSTTPIILFKYGGNAMTNIALQAQILEQICSLKAKGINVVIVHGGGPFIKEALQKANIESDFIDGHRVTTPEALKYVEMALKGQVNGNLVSLINSLGYNAVGLSGKDGKMVIAQKRWHHRLNNGITESIDIGLVGDVESVDTTLLDILLQNDYIPVITCLANDKNGESFNINGDMFAGHIAGALQVRDYVVLTDVDGLLKDISDPASLIDILPANEIKNLIDTGIIAGGMLPKVESCTIALAKGAKTARILNGTKPEQVAALASENPVGTSLIP